MRTTNTARKKKNSMATGREFVTESETSIYVWCTIKWNNNVTFQLTTINRSRRLDMRQDTITSEPFYLMSMGINVEYENNCIAKYIYHLKIKELVKYKPFAS